MSALITALNGRIWHASTGPFTEKANTSHRVSRKSFDVLAAGAKGSGDTLYTSLFCRRTTSAASPRQEVPAESNFLHQRSNCHLRER